MVRKIYLFDSPTDPRDLNHGYYFRNLDYEGIYIKKIMKNFLKEENNIIDDIYCSPYLASLQLAIEISKITKIQFKIDNALYDVLDKEKYQMFRCNYYWSDQIKNILKKKNTVIKEHDILNHREPYYESSILASNIKYGEDDTRINNRIGSFIFKILKKSMNKSNILLICHKSLFIYIYNYMKFYNSTNKNEEKIDIIIE